MQYFVWAAAAAYFLLGGLFPAGGATGPTRDPSDIRNDVQQKIANLSYYGVFDNIGFLVHGTEVTLTGQVVNPVVKDDAADAVKSVPGVTAVLNEIEILPPSSTDAQLRRAIFRAIFNDPAMSLYAIQPVPSIHIIVKNGNVTLVGVVADQSDKAIAFARASSVPGTFMVNNDLLIIPGAGL